MPNEPSLAEKLLDAVEFFFRENSALKLMLGDHHIPNWESELRKLMAVPQIKEQIAAMFLEVRERVRADNDPIPALERILKIFPADRNLN